MEEVVQRMRTDITLQFEGTANNARNKDSASFRILYVSGEARTAQKTTERLASLFIEENLRDRANVSEDTNRFLESQLQDARRRLEEQEKKVEQYRLRYSGQLPSQASANLQAIQNVQLQLQSLREASDRARERRLLVERQLADLQSPDPVVAAVPAPVAGPGRNAASRPADGSAAAGRRTRASPHPRSPVQAHASGRADAATHHPRARGEGGGGAQTTAIPDPGQCARKSCRSGPPEANSRAEGSDRRRRSRAGRQAAAGEGAARGRGRLSGKAGRCPDPRVGSR